MSTRSIDIDCSMITNCETFHDAFSTAFSFPAYYGRNMDAWIDCMSDVAVPTRIEVRLLNVEGLERIDPSIVVGLVTCTAFVNARLTTDAILLVPIASA